jgi:Zn-dependent protease
MEPIQILSIVILILSIVAHEVSHGYAALLCGDPTAKIAGRLTPNPLKHLDLIGSLVVPVIFFFTSGGVAGWAKPVPYNPYMLRGRFAELFVASAGVLTNILIACIFGMVLRFLPNETIAINTLEVISTIIYINIGLFVFNLLPFPPFDGLRIITSIAQAFGVSRRKFDVFEHPMWIFISLLIAFNIWPVIAPIVQSIFKIIVL